MPPPNGYGESVTGQVTLTMSKNDYNSLLFALGVATGASSYEAARLKSFLELINRLNAGNPNFTPYATT